MNVLAIGAHFDDIELGCGGTIAKHVKDGDRTIMYVHTHSGYFDYLDSNNRIRCYKRALEEGKDAANILGVELIHSNFDTCKVQYNDDLICTLKEVIEKNEIDLIYTHWEHDVHQDHRALGQATISAGRHIPRILMYRSNWYDTSQIFRGNLYIDISSCIEIKKLAVKAHKSEYKRVGEKWLNFFLHQNKNSGLQIGVEYAETFEVVKYLL